MSVKRENMHIIIGAGAIGLAIARALSLRGERVLVLERENSVGQHLSSRGSGVIHAGMYYKPGSLKAGLSVKGREMLYEYCAHRNIPHRRIGKLIVAITEKEILRLQELRTRGEENGVHDLALLSEKEVRSLEPFVQSVAGLYSPSTGIIDAAAYMTALECDVKEQGGKIQFGKTVTGGRIEKNGITLILLDGETIHAKTVINCGGLFANEIARSIEGFPHEKIPRMYYAKGNYFRYSSLSPFSHLVYPVPISGGLGIHATLNMKNEVRFGPDVEWNASMDYTVDPSREKQFYTAIRTYFPTLADGALVPLSASIRPKLAPEGNPDADFLIQTPRDHGIPNIINLFGIESPGLTSSLALGEYVAKMI